MAEFDKLSQQRIARAVLWCERQNRNPRLPHRQVLSKPAERWVQITDGASGKYSWEAIKPQSDGTWVVDTVWGTGDHTATSGYAVEIEHLSAHVLDDSIVRLTPAPGEYFYWFEYHPRDKNAVATSAITAASGTTPGTGTATVYDYDGTSLSAGQTGVTIKNRYTTAVTSGNDLVITYMDGWWWVTGEECVEA